MKKIILSVSLLTTCICQAQSITAIGASLNMEKETWPVDPVLIEPVITCFDHFVQCQRF